MSGSDGPSVGVGGGGGSDCARTRLTRVLAGPDPTVVGTLSIGSVLAVQLDPGPPEAVIVVASGKFAGTVTAATELRECLRQGIPFKATVTDISGGAVSLLIVADL